MPLLNKVGSFIYKLTTCQHDISNEIYDVEQKTGIYKKKKTNAN